MGKLTVLALRVVLVMLLGGSVFVQAVMVPLLAVDLREAGADPVLVRAPVIAIVFLGIVAVQAVLVCVWLLVTKVRRGTVFSSTAFRYVDVMIGAIVAAALLVFGLGFVMAPGEAVPPGVVLLVGGAGMALLGVALIVVVLRTLLAQAIESRAEASRLRGELDEVI
ncbi:DUF2975 domain-containing protein [Nocardiopsis sp. NPDC006198]|uniref:DUF2975 domain-containing protein n=1 Tax=Nocardiopsis sp. NPDC006198 TaxID=3154472 RepID=UPI0033B75122